MRPISLVNKWLVVGFHQKSDWADNGCIFDLSNKAKYIYFTSGRLYGDGDNNKNIGWKNCSESGNELVCKFDFAQRQLIFELNQNKETPAVSLPFDQEANEWVFSFITYYHTDCFEIEFFEEDK